MNGFSENPFFFFVDNALPMFPMDVYQDVGKIIELSDTGCDAISPSSSVGRKNDENQPYMKKTLRPDGFSFRKAFDEKRETNREELKKKGNNTKGNTKGKNKLPEDKKTFPRKGQTKEFTEERFKIQKNTEINEKTDQWERSNDFADFENTLLRNERNLANYDYSSWIKNDIIDPDLIFFNLPNYSMDKEPNLKKKKEEDDKNFNESKSDSTERRLSRTRNSNELRKLEKGSKKKGISSESRSPQKEQENELYEIVSDGVRDDAKTSRKDESKDINGEIRKTIDRAVDKDSLSNNSENNVENLNKGENLSLKFNMKGNFESIEKSKEKVHRRRRFNRETNNNKTDVSEVRKISKSADFDKSKRRANGSWVKSSRNNSTIPKVQEKKSFHDKEHYHITPTNNYNSRSKYGSNNAGSHYFSRRVEKTKGKKEKMEEKKTEEKINMASSFDDNSDTSNKWENKNQISGKSLLQDYTRSVLEEKENDKVGIRKKDLDKIGAIFLASSLRKSGKLPNSKTAGNLDRSSLKNNKSDQLETSKMEKSQYDRMLFSSQIRPISISNLSQLPSKTEKSVNIKSIKSRIPIAISRIKKELEDNNNYFKFCNFCNRSRSRLRSKSIVTETDRSNENKIDESTSTAIILVDKSDCTRDEDNEKDDRLGTGLDSLNTRRIGESRRKRKMDVELKVLKMANDVKQRRREKFEKCGLREPLKKLINESQEIIDIAVTILEKDSKRQEKSSNVGRRLVVENDYRNDYRNREEVYSSRPYSLRSGMYSKYFPNYFPFNRYLT